MMIADLTVAARAAPLSSKPDTTRNGTDEGISFQESLKSQVEAKTEVNTNTQEAEKTEPEKETVEEQAIIAAAVITAAPAVIIPIILPVANALSENESDLSDSAQIIDQQANLSAALLASDPENQISQASTEEATLLNQEQTLKTPAEDTTDKMFIVPIDTSKAQETTEVKTQVVETNVTTGVKENTTVSPIVSEQGEKLFTVEVNGEQIVFKATAALEQITQGAEDKTASVVLPQVVHGVKEMLSQGRASINLQIHPENMGTINVRLVSGSDGVQVYFNASKASTSQLLENNLAQLQELLQSSGVKLGGMSVGQQNTQQEQWNGQNQSPTTLPVDFLGRDEIKKVNSFWSQKTNSSSALDYQA